MFDGSKDGCTFGTLGDMEYKSMVASILGFARAVRVFVQLVINVFTFGRTIFKVKATLESLYTSEFFLVV